MDVLLYYSFGDSYKWDDYRLNKINAWLSESKAALGLHFDVDRLYEKKGFS